MIFLDCPAYQDEEGTARCGLPAEVRYRSIMRSTGGPLESAVIRCPAGHWFNGPIESLTWERTDNDDADTAAGAPSARHDSLRNTHDGHDRGGGFATRESPTRLHREVPRPNGAPAYYLGRPARLWITAMSPRRSRIAANHLMEAVTVADDERYPSAAVPQPTVSAAGRVPLTLA